jgi:NADPH:quinone reductase-like Zn-dependent oxidoreductase
VGVKVMKINSANQEPVLVAADIPGPVSSEGEILVRVHAAGVTPTELLWYPSTHARDGAARIGAIPGHEFSGVVTAIGSGIKEFSVGDEVFGMNDWFDDGATAEFCLARPENVALKPKSLSHALAATVPIGALTAWQGLLDRAKLMAGERVLIHGGGGSVGLFAVQLAHLRGAHVIATASGRKSVFVSELGADEVVDYTSSRFEDQVDKVDVVFDGVGGETLGRSWAVLKPGGRMVTIAADSEGTTDQRVKDAFFIVEPNGGQLMEIARLLEAGKLRTFVSATVPLQEAASAYRGMSRNNDGYGKAVISVLA